LRRASCTLGELALDQVRGEVVDRFFAELGEYASLAEAS